MDNPYHILGISPSASSEEIKKAYRALAMRHHPDRTFDSDSVMRFNAIQKAYELLSDHQKRTEYNQSVSKKIILDPDEEARHLWRVLFNRHGLTL